MPERVTPEERLVSLAIEKARKVKEALSQREPTQVIDVEHGGEMEKVKRPKAEKVTTKISNQEREGYGLAGQVFKKSVNSWEQMAANAEALLRDGKTSMPKEAIEMIISDAKRFQELGVPYTSDMADKVIRYGRQKAGAGFKPSQDKGI